MQQKLMQLGTLILAVLFGDWPSRKLLLTNYLGYANLSTLSLSLAQHIHLLISVSLEKPLFSSLMIGGL